MKVQSSTISEINYDGKLLTITFNNGSEYVYEGVSEKIYEDFSKAESKENTFMKTLTIDTIIRELSKEGELLWKIKNSM